MSANLDNFNTCTILERPHGAVSYFALEKLSIPGQSDIARLPNTVKVLLENVLRQHDGELVTDEDVAALARWGQPDAPEAEIPFLPARVVLQDFTGVPAVVDFAALRSAVARLGGDPQQINPLAPVDLVIDHSVQVDSFGTSRAFEENVALEYERNKERYSLLRWAQKAFQNFRVVPPGTGIVHQVNLEYLGSVVTTRERNGLLVALPDTLVGTDSHTTMINGLGVLGWGVGGIEAEACLLGQPLYLLLPEVIGFKFVGQLREGVTATDLVLTVTQILRRHGVVGRFVEYYGSGLSALSLADRATIGNMSPEYGATAGFFPVDEATLTYLRLTGRDEQLVDLVERYTKAQGMFRTDETPDPIFTETLELDLSTVEPSLAGPRRPQDRVPLPRMKHVLQETYGQEIQSRADKPKPEIAFDGERVALDHGSVAIAAITSCTNTSNPSVLIGAGLLAKNAVERGLKVKPYVKTSLAPGSPVVTDYLKQADLMPYLEALGFHLVGYGCTTCIGNSGPLPEPVANAVQENDLIVSAVLSGNRNFEGRIHPQVRASFLASPPLVVAYALAGRTDIDLAAEPLGHDPNGDPVYLRDIWPTSQDIEETIREHVTAEMFRQRYANVFAGDAFWAQLPTPEGSLYDWDPNSTYVQEPPYFQDMSPEVPPLQDISNARVLVMLDDSITTDHISPAGSIQVNSPAGQYLISHGVERADFNSYGARRGNHEVMIRGTFANIRLRNRLVDRTGPYTIYLPTGEEMSIYDAGLRYQAEGTPLLVIAGKEYGSGSSRDWAAKGTQLLGIRAVIAESYERIHRSNLVGMGVLPLQFTSGQNKESLGLTGRETYTIAGLANGVQVGQRLTVQVKREDGSEFSFEALARIDSPIEIEYYRNGGILQFVLRRLLAQTSN